MLRAPQVEAIDFVELDAESVPAEVALVVALRAVYYLEDPISHEVLVGSADTRRRITMHWKLVLDGDADAPWRVASVHME